MPVCDGIKPKNFLVIRELLGGNAGGRGRGLGSGHVGDVTMGGQKPYKLNESGALPVFNLGGNSRFLLCDSQSGLESGPLS